MARIKMHIPKAKLPFYLPYEVKYRLQNGVSTDILVFLTREDFELVGKLLMEYGSGTFPLQASHVLSSKQTV